MCAPACSSNWWQGIPKFVKKLIFLHQCLSLTRAIAIKTGQTKIFGSLQKLLNQLRGSKNGAKISVTFFRALALSLSLPPDSLPIVTSLAVCPKHWIRSIFLYNLKDLGAKTLSQNRTPVSLNFICYAIVPDPPQPGPQYGAYHGNVYTDQPPPMGHQASML